MAQSFSFSTVQLPGAQSVDAWRQAMAEVYYRLDVKSDHSERLNGQLIDWQSDIMVYPTSRRMPSVSHAGRKPRRPTRPRISSSCFQPESRCALNSAVTRT
jgi:hypothetical protein